MSFLENMERYKAETAKLQADIERRKARLIAKYAKPATPEQNEFMPEADAPKRGKGRPMMAPDERQVTVSLRLSPDDARRFREAGGKDWLARTLAHNDDGWTTITDVVERLTDKHGTQAEAARQCGVDKTYWCRLMNGFKDRPGNDTMERMGVERRVQYRFKKGTK